MGFIVSDLLEVHRFHKESSEALVSYLPFSVRRNFLRHRAFNHRCKDCVILSDYTINDPTSYFTLWFWVAVPKCSYGLVNDRKDWSYRG